MQTENGHPSQDVKHAIDDASDAIKGRVEDLKARVSELRAKGDEILENLTRAIKANPMRAVAIAAAAGFLGAKVLRR